jgi:CheY-like chemotaxis protein
MAGNSNGGLNILLVEDSADDRLMMEALLKTMGHRMCWADSAKGSDPRQNGGARSLLATEEIDIVILDWHLAHGDTGLDVIRYVPRGIPVLIRSAATPAYILADAASVRHPLAGVSLILERGDVIGLMREINRVASQLHSDVTTVR